MRYFFVSTIVCSFFLFNQNALAFASGNPAYTAITYWMAHGSMLHLAVNVIGLFGFWGLLQKLMPPHEIAMVAVASSTLGALLVRYDMPLMGASAMLYTLLGLWAQFVFIKRIRFKNSFDMWLAIGSVATFSIIGLLKANIAGALHLVCMAMGAVYGYCRFKK